MKKEFVLILLIALVIVISGCAEKQDIDTGDDIEITLIEGGSRFFVDKLMTEILNANIQVCKEPVNGNMICTIDPNIKLEKDILVDCAKNYQNENSDYNFEGKHSCVFFSEKVKYFYLDMIKNLDYEFVSVFETIEIIYIKKTNGCPRNDNLIREVGEQFPKSLSSPPYPIMTDIGLIQSTLYVCN
ncbi:MAG: hypothetical protein KJ597_00905 [Nanoarchaeota archaeon]|nr:hypothetical protein [Nanoarchaeota archaeon]MBU1622110.1 hypothetical protein [Nanoarchaeota archaeon]